MGGVGIYCSPQLHKALRYADVPLFVGGDPYTLVFQCRVRRKSFEKPDSHIWLVRNTGDIRPCGVLLYPFALTDDRQIKYRRHNPYKLGSGKWETYKEYSKARTVAQAKEMGRRMPQILNDLHKGRLRLKDAHKSRHLFSKAKSLDGHKVKPLAKRKDKGKDKGNRKDKVKSLVKSFR